MIDINYLRRSNVRFNIENQNRFYNINNLICAFYSYIYAMIKRHDCFLICVIKIIV